MNAASYSVRIECVLQCDSYSPIVSECTVQAWMVSRHIPWTILLDKSPGKKPLPPQNSPLLGVVSPCGRRPWVFVWGYFLGDNCPATKLISASNFLLCTVPHKCASSNKQMASKIGLYCTYSSVTYNQVRMHLNSMLFIILSF